MLGYGAVAERYPVEMPRVLRSAGYFTASKGKDHFGWDNVLNQGIAHGYNSTLVRMQHRARVCLYTQLLVWLSCA